MVALLRMTPFCTKRFGDKWSSLAGHTSVNAQVVVRSIHRCCSGAMYG